MKIKKGDTVKILYGKETGKQGTVVAVSPKKNSVIVEGLNLYKRHLKGDGQTRQSEILTIEKPFELSKVMLVCPNCNKPTRVGIKRVDGKPVRVCKKCNKDIVEKEKTTVTKKKVEKKEVKKTTKTKTVKKESKK
ncbi:MAG: 50S ribosomal protein L24 [Candidatus Dojkabacteria bacterium]|jgi:large subunit ribosomal protein L24